MSVKKEKVPDVLSFLHGRVLFHTQRRMELRLKILYPYLPKLAVKAQQEQSRIEHWRQKIEMWESLDRDK